MGIVKLFNAECDGICLETFELHYGPSESPQRDQNAKPTAQLYKKKLLIRIIDLLFHLSLSEW